MSRFSIIPAGHVLGRVQGRLPENHSQRHRDSRARQHRPARNQRCQFPFFISPLLSFPPSPAVGRRSRVCPCGLRPSSTQGLFTAARWLGCRSFWLGNGALGENKKRRRRNKFRFRFAHLFSLGGADGCCRARAEGLIGNLTNSVRCDNSRHLFILGKLASPSPGRARRSQR